MCVCVFSLGGFEELRDVSHKEKSRRVLFLLTHKPQSYTLLKGSERGSGTKNCYFSYEKLSLSYFLRPLEMTGCDLKCLRLVLNFS